MKTASYITLFITSVFVFYGCINQEIKEKKTSSTPPLIAPFEGVDSIAINDWWNRKPNILIILADDQGYADLSAYDHAAPDISTPNMDKLARDGVLLTNAYVAAPVCSPSRASWITGKYSQRWDNNAGWSPGLPHDVKTLAEYIQEGGYVTGRVGKNHISNSRRDSYLAAREHPLNHGFDWFLGTAGGDHSYFLLSDSVYNETPDTDQGAHLGPLYHNKGFLSLDTGYTTEIFTDSAMGFMERHRDTSFFLVVSYNAVHHLIHEVPKPYLDKYGVPEIPKYDPLTMGNYNDYYNIYNSLAPISDADMRKYYLANLNCLDDNIGRLLDKVNYLGLKDSTMVIYFSDNGGSPLTGANNTPLRGSKYRLFEGGIRVPFLLRWPGVLPAGTVYNYRISALDILPTCLAAAGVPLARNTVFDGHNMLQALSTNTPSATHLQPMFWKWQDNNMVLAGKWKYVTTSDYTLRTPTSQILQGPVKGKAERLFDLSADPSEQENVLEANPEITDSLRQLYENWEADLSNMTVPVETSKDSMRDFRIDKMK